MKRLLLATVSLLFLAGGCEPVRRASPQSLQVRAYFELACPSQQIQFYRINARTTAAMGCGRRHVYLEHCDATLPGEQACSWTLDSSMSAQHVPSRVPSAPSPAPSPQREPAKFLNPLGI